MTFAAISPFDGARPARPQRARGAVSIAIVRGSAGPSVERRAEAGAARVRFPRPVSADAVEAILINTAGGLTGGDRFAVTAEIGAGAAAILTTQAAEKVYRSAAGAAEIAVKLSVGPAARLDWLPQETILFNGSALERRLDAEVAKDGRLLLVEPTVFGRTAMGERLIAARFRDRWRVRRDGRLAFADDTAFSGAVADLLGRPAVLDGNCAMATLAYFGPDAERLGEPLAALIGDNGGASAFDGKLIARCVAEDGFALRRVLGPAIALLRNGAATPRSWAH